MYVIPRIPAWLNLPITSFWNGAQCYDVYKHGLVSIAQTEDGLLITASLAQQKEPNLPPQPFGTYVPNLWEYDVVECFLVGENVYLEVEFGAAGHILVLDFSAPRKRLHAYTEFCPKVKFEVSYSAGARNSNVVGTVYNNISVVRWQSSINIPWRIVPEKIKAVNAFVIVRNNFLAFSPLNGDMPDFHQPAHFPSARLLEHAKS
jgi:hypothetical protein